MSQLDKQIPRILVVDDNEQILQLYKNILSPQKNLGKYDKLQNDFQSEIFGDVPNIRLEEKNEQTFTLEFASQGLEAIKKPRMPKTAENHLPLSF